MQKKFIPFGEKIKILRVTYGLSMKNIADLLGYKNSGTISQIEAGIITPSYANLIQFANFYGVHLDWLIGRSYIIYTDESLEFSEKSFKEQIDDLKIEETEISELYRITWFEILKTISLAYYNHDSRIRYYTLPVRANILVLLHVVSLPALCWAWVYILHGENKRGVNKEVEDYLRRKSLITLAEEFKTPLKKEMHRAIELVKLLKLETHVRMGSQGQIESVLQKKLEPIYDVEKCFDDL